MKKEKKFTTKLTEKEINDGVKLSKKMEKKYYATSKAKTIALVAVCLLLAGSTGYLTYRTITNGGGGGDTPTPTPTPTGDTYTVTFKDSNENELKTEKNMVYAIQPSLYEFTDKATTRGYCKISKWYTDKSCSGEAFNFSTTKLTKDITLYGQFEKSTCQYTIHSLNGDETEGSASALFVGTVSEQTPYVYESDLPKTLGIARKKITGWTNTKGGTTPISNWPLDCSQQEQHIWPITSQEETLLTFGTQDSNTILCDESTVSSIPATGTTRALPTPKSASGYKFKNWRVKNANGIKVKIDGVETTIAKDADFTPAKDADFLSNDEIDLWADFDNEDYSVNATFYNSTDTSTGTVIKTIKDISKVNGYDVSGLESQLTVPTGKRFYGWGIADETKETWTRNDVVISSSIAYYEIKANTKFVPVFVDADGDITIKLNGGTWAKAQKAADDVSISIWEDVAMSNEDILKAVRAAAGVAADDYLTKSGNLNFSYFTKNQTAITGQTYLTKTDTVAAEYISATTILATFDLDGGYFYYTNDNGITVSTETIYIELTKKDTGGYTYDNLKTACETKYKNLKWVNDGYKLNASGEYVGWITGGNKVKSTDTFNASASFVADWIEESASDFWSDGWATVSGVANRGFTALYSTYYKAFHSKQADGTGTSVTKWGNGATSAESETPTTDANGTFVGLEKDLTLSGFGTFKTRVIGQKQDKIYIDSSSYTTTALTFDFVQVPLMGGYSTGSNDYLTGLVETTYAPLVKYAMPNGLKDNLKLCRKPVLQTASTGSCSMTSLDTYLFLPSAYEVYGGTDKTQTTETKVKDGSAYDENQYKDVATYKSYMFGYDWYSYNFEGSYQPSTKARSRNLDKGGGTHGSSVPSDMKYRVKANPTSSSSTASWHLRTPISSSYNPESISVTGTNFYVTEDEGSGKPSWGGIYSYYSTDSRGLDFCFAIGIA